MCTSQLKETSLMNFTILAWSMHKAYGSLLVDPTRSAEFLENDTHVFIWKCRRRSRRRFRITHSSFCSCEKKHDNLSYLQKIFMEGLGDTCLNL